jgi:NADPH2:quinone reductase
VNHAIRLHKTGGPEVLRFEEVEIGEPAAGEALVRHTAIGVNFIDTYHRSGLYPLPAYPSPLGSEAAGVIEALGPGVTDLSVGQRVGYATGGVGAYAEMRRVPADKLIPLPDEISDELAAASMLKGMTAEYLIRRTYPVRGGDTVLWHAAAGGVGLIASQWLAHLGARVIGTVGSDEKAAIAREHGCQHTIVYTRENFVERVLEITESRKVPVVYDSVGKSTFAGSLDCLMPRGMLVVFGNASGKPDPFDLGVLSAKGSLYITRPTLFTYTQSRGELLTSASSVFDLMRSGVIKVAINQRFALKDAAEAHRALESRATIGSTLLIP